jgi:putative SOS response-associated peptidase YedK
MASLQSLLVPYSIGAMAIYAVSDRVNNVKSNSLALLTAV